AYRNKVELPEGDVLPVFTVDIGVILDFLGRHLHGERFAKGGSLFSGKLGQRLCAEKITLELNRDPLEMASPFVDAEGVVLPGDRRALSDDGRLARVLPDKKAAQSFGLEHTGAALGECDDPPTIDGSHARHLCFRPGSQNV